jgi:hypothetical protein
VKASEIQAGMRFGRLVAVRYESGSRADRGKWFCRCDCGRTTAVVKWSLTNGNTRSCGCLRGFVDGDMKRCNACSTMKPLSDFATTERDGVFVRRASQCKECVSRIWTTRHRPRKYGLTPEQLESMSVRAGHACEICRKTESEIGKRLSIDHCHRTGAVRGLLCDSCNHTLGKMRESPELLERAAAYLRERQP